MRTSGISFCDKLAYNIKSDETKHAVLAQLAAWGIRIIRKHYDAFDGDRTITRLNTQPHLLCARTNGNPYLLYLTRYERINTCIFIDKKVQHGYTSPRMIVTHMGFDDELFRDGTVLEGEMVRVAQHDWVFVLNDAVVHRGRAVGSDLVERVSLAYALLENHFSPKPRDVFRMEVKRYFAVTEMRALLQEFVPSLPYTCRGVCFRAIRGGMRDVLLNHDDSLVTSARMPKHRAVVVEAPSSKRSKHTAQTPQAQQQTQTQMQARREQAQQQARREQAQQQQARREQAQQQAQQQQANAQHLQFGRTDRNDNVVLYARKTSTVDVYELYASPRGGALVGHLAVPDIHGSLALQAAFDDLNCAQTLALQCTRVSETRWARV
jgi:hypothetical protein